jgi:hypothetical protein
VGTALPIRGPHRPATAHREAPCLDPSPRSSTDCPIGHIESINTKIRLITRIVFGFGSLDAPIALDHAQLGGHLPWPDVTRRTSQESQKSVSAITYISVIPDTECGFFLEAARSSWCSS